MKLKFVKNLVTTWQVVIHGVKKILFLILSEVLLAVGVDSFATLFTFKIIDHVCYFRYTSRLECRRQTLP